MYLYFFFLAVFSTAILGNPVAEAQHPPSSSSSLDNFISFLPQDLSPPNPNPDQGTYADALGSQISNGETFLDLTILDQTIGPPNLVVFEMALAPSSQGEKIDDETAHYRSFTCKQKYSVCCEGRDHSINSQHKPCSQSK